MIERCACGLPLHYSDPSIRIAVETMIRITGEEYLTIKTRGRAWRVQKHYIALHGIKAAELERLGFLEITGYS